MHVKRENLAPFTTKDGSIITEFIHPSWTAAKNQSLAEAVVPEGTETFTHRHPVTEELYHFTKGRGLMRLGDETFEVTAGDTVLIEPGVVHGLKNVGDGDLAVLCCCSPAYSHEDTVLEE
ncbi:MAG: cupin domain-containing protein, partial [Desulfovibrionaceae bacterium]